MGIMQDKHEQGTDLWLEQRKGVITASKSGQIAYSESAKRDLLREEIRTFIGAPSELQEKLKDKLKYGLWYSLISLLLLNH